MQNLLSFSLICVKLARSLQLDNEIPCVFCFLTFGEHILVLNSQAHWLFNIGEWLFYKPSKKKVL